MDRSIEALFDADPCVLSHQDRLDLLVELDRLAARVAARTQRVLAAIHIDPPAMLPGTPQKILDKAFVREEVACLLRWSPGVTGSRMHEAADLIDRLPTTLAELESGRFSFGHAKTLLDATAPLDLAQVAKVEKRVLPRAGEQTVANFRRSVQRAVARIDTRRVADRHRDAAADRRAVLCPERDGMASLYAYLPAPDADRIMDRITAAANKAKGLDDRSVDQRRADALIDFITASSTGARRSGRAEVQITLSLDTLTGRSAEPGELAG